MGSKEKTQTPTAAPDAFRSPPTRSTANPSSKLGNDLTGKLIQARQHATHVVRFSENGQELTEEERAKKENLAASMSALDDPELLPIYQDWLVLQGRAQPSPPSAAHANAPAAVTIGSAASAQARILQLRASLESGLHAQDLDLATFEKRIAHFEEVFREATAELGIALIDRTEALCRQHLQNIDALSSKLFTAVAPVRKPVLDALRRARHLTGEAYRGELDALNEPLRAKSAPRLRREAEEARSSAHELMALTLGEDFPFIAWPDFSREKLAQCESREEVRAFLAKYFNDHVDELAKAREQLKADPKRIYKLDLLLSTAQSELDIDEGSILEDIIQQQVKLASHMGPLEALETVLGFALTVVTIFVPVAAPVTVPIGAALSVHSAVQAIEHYREGAADYRAGLSSDMPSMGWVIFALAGAALDAPVIMKFLRLNKLWEAVRNLQRSRDVERFVKELGNLPESLPEAARAALERAARNEINAAGKGEPPWYKRIFGGDKDPNTRDAERIHGLDGWGLLEHERLLNRLGKGVERGMPGPLTEPPTFVPSGVSRQETVLARGAYDEYQEAVLLSRGRPVTLLHHPERGVYQVIIGKEPGLFAFDEGWDVVVYFKPQGNALGLPPLPTYEQLLELYRRNAGNPKRVRMFIEHDIPGVGRGRTEFGFDPAHRKTPLYIRTHRVTGTGLTGKGRITSETRRFADPDAYVESPNKQR